MVAHDGFAASLPLRESVARHPLTRMPLWRALGKLFSLCGLALLAFGLWTGARGAAPDTAERCADQCCGAAACGCCDDEVPLARSACDQVSCGAQPGIPGHPSPAGTLAFDLLVVLERRSADAPEDERPALRASGCWQRWPSRRPAPEPLPPRGRPVTA